MVATLLVAVVGATFAYFTATSSNAGNLTNNKQDVETAKLADVKLTSSETSKSENSIYPGTMNYVGAQTAASVDVKEGAEGKTYTITYTVKGKVSVDQEFDQTIKYRLYELDQNVEAPVTCDEVTSTNVGNEVRFHQECQENELLDDTEMSGNAIKTGTITGADPVEIEVPGRTIDTGETKYYYLVVEYPNNDGGDQNSDMGKKITIELTGITATSTAEKTE